MYNVSKVAGLLSLLGLAAAAWFSILLARADAEFRKGTPRDVARAVELTPRSTAYLSQQALQIEYEGGDSRPLLAEIARINPGASAPRIRLGLDAEVRGDLGSAERWLLEAARVDRQYEPRWALANFYFRQQKMDDFWKWMRSALEVSYGDRAAAFDLASAASPDTRTILARAIPDQHEVVAAYLAHLLHGGKGSDWTPVALLLSQFHDPTDLPALHWTLDVLAELEHWPRDNALKIWRNLGYPEPVAPVYNPDFGPPRIGHGFDWQFMEVPGVKVTHLDTPLALRVSFSGMQPESCPLLKQYAGISRLGKRYLLRWESRTRGLPANTGLAWAGNRDRGPLQASDDWTAGQLPFRGFGDYAVIALYYNRPLGEPRAEGSVDLRHVSIEEQP
jgi:hypothetical protein